MKKKIRDYVEYYLRMNTQGENPDLTEEIISNITDRYEALLAESRDEQYAYVQAIKTIGSFTDAASASETRSYKPQIAEMFLITALITAIASLIVALLSPVIGGIIVTLSIVSFGVGATYLYQQAEFIKNNEFDIEKSEYYTNKIFRYAKTSYKFWAIVISYLIAMIVYKLFLVGYASSEFGQISDISGSDFATILLVCAIIFLIAFIIILLIFFKLYRRAEKKYLDSTGKKNIDSVGNTMKSFLGYNERTKRNTIFDKPWFYPTITLALSLIALALLILTHQTFDRLHRGSEQAALTVSYIISVMMIIFSILGFKVIKSHYFTPIIYIIGSIIIFFAAIYIWSFVVYIAFFSVILLLILIVIDLLVK